MSRKICVITGSRADYGLLRWVMQGIKDDPSLTLQVIATGMHLSPEFGLTYREIEDDGFTIDRKVEMLTSSDTPVGIAKSMGLGMIGFADALHELSPDLILVLGDRFEIMAAVQVAVLLQTPVAHLCGGDIGSGTFDNIFRQCISKMSNLHFVTHETSRVRVIQLGERREMVYCFGSTCVDSIRKVQLLTLEQLKIALGIEFSGTVILVTFHPLTLGSSSSIGQLRALLGAIEKLELEMQTTIIFSKSNADNGGYELNAELEQFVRSKPSRYLFDSLGHINYLSVMKHASLVLGNSSSGIYEAPYLQSPTVDIGERQRGREAPASVFRCEAIQDSIHEAINMALKFRFTETEMIYGDGDASINILATIKRMLEQQLLDPKNISHLEIE